MTPDCDPPAPEHLVIGNGPSLLRHRLGSVVDRAQTVYRFNRWQTQGYEAHTGTKTDVWIVNNADIVKKRIVEAAETGLCIKRFIVAPIPGKNDMEKTASFLMRSFEGAHIERVPFELFERLSASGPMNVSTGTLVLTYLAERLERPVVTLGVDILASEATRGHSGTRWTAAAGFTTSTWRVGCLGSSSRMGAFMSSRTNWRVLNGTEVNESTLRWCRCLRLGPVRSPDNLP